MSDWETTRSIFFVIWLLGVPALIALSIMLASRDRT